MLGAQERDRWGALYLRLEGERSWVELLACWRWTEEEFPSDPANSTGARGKWHSTPSLNIYSGMEAGDRHEEGTLPPPPPPEPPLLHGGWTLEQ